MNTLSGSTDVLSLRRLQDHTLPTAKYLDKPNPQEILRRGFIEEVHEVCVAFDEGDIEQASGEIGDLLWYASEFSRHMPEYMDGREADLPLDIMHNMAGPALDIESVAREHTGLEEVSQNDILTIAALRLVDSMQPEDDSLWRQPRGRVTVAVALNEFLFIVGTIAQDNKLTLSSSAEKTLEKLRTRTRNTNVLEAIEHPEAHVAPDHYEVQLRTRLGRRGLQGAEIPDSQAS